MNGYGKIRAVIFTELAAGTGIGIFYYGSACFALFENLFRTEGNTYATTLAPVFENFLNKELFALFFKILFWFFFFLFAIGKNLS
jgi:hypothetical protein